MHGDSAAEPAKELTLPEITKFEQFKGLVESEFIVEEGLLLHAVPTFYVKTSQNSKEAFLRLLKRLDPDNFIPILRKKEGRLVLQIVSRPPAKPSRLMINVALFFGTICTVLLTGYLQSEGLWRYELMSNPFLGAALFAGGLMAIVGTHEMGHKLTANRHGIEATYPYFIPGPPPFGTFGALIQQKSLAPNKDALFDLGASGPVLGFIVAIVVTVIGISYSYPMPFSQAEAMGAEFFPTPLIFVLLSSMVWSNLPVNYVIMMHPMAFAGWIGILVTLLNLMPIGMLDGGHTVQSLLAEKARRILAFVAVLSLVFMGYYLFALIAFFLSLQRHPGPLDNASELSGNRKLVAIVLVSIFILCLPETVLPQFLF